MQVEMPAGVAPIGLFWKHGGRRSRTRAHAHIWLISSKLKHFVRGVHSRYTHASTRRLNLSLERDTYSELGYISPFSIYSLSNYILVSPKKWRRAASRQLPCKLHGCSGPPLKTEGMKCIHLFSNMLWVCLHVFSGWFTYSHFLGTTQLQVNMKKQVPRFGFTNVYLQITKWIL